MLVNANLSSLFAENALATTMSQMSTLQQEMATGESLTSPAVNPADSAITSLMTGELGNLSQSTTNLAQGLNLLQTANGGLQTDIQTVQQLQQLAVQASNGDLTTQDRADLQAQAENLLQVINHTSHLQYNGINLGAKASIVYAPSSSAIITNIAGATGDKKGQYTVQLQANGYYLDASLIYNGQVVATGSTVNPYPVDSSDPGYYLAPLGTKATANSYNNVNSAIENFVTVLNDDPGTYQVTFSTPQYLTNLSFGEYGDPYSQTVNISGANSSGQWTTIGNVTTESDSISNFSITPGTYQSILFNINQSLPNAQIAKLSFGSIPSTADLNIHWSTASVGYGSPLTVQYNPAALATDSSTQSSFVVLPDTTLVGGPGAAVSVAFGLLSTQQLGIQNLSLDTAQQAQQTLTDTHSVLNILSTIQSTFGSQMEAINSSTQVLQEEHLNLQASRATLQDANMAQVTASFSEKQILAQTGLQALASANQLPSLILKYLG